LSAAQSGRFCERWVLGVQQSGDSDGESPARAHPLPAGGTERLPANPQIRGAGLANLLQAYDRQAGYPMAWFFNMLASAGVADGIGRQVADDHQDGGFSYLPARDLELLRR